MAHIKKFIPALLLILLVACNPEQAPTSTPAPTLPLPTQGPTPTPTATPPPTPGGGILHQSGPFAANLAPGVPGNYTINGAFGSAIAIEVRPEDESLDLQIRIYAGANELARVDQAGANQGETLPEFQFPIDGQYTITIATLAGSGLMRGDLRFLNPAEHSGGGMLDQDEAGTISAELAAPDVFHAYRFTAEANEIIILRAAADNQALDLYFILFGPTGARIGLFDNDAPPNLPELRDRWLEQAGTYTALVGARSGTGNYQMILEPGG